MTPRSIQDTLRFLLANFPVVAVLGARQVGKTTLVHAALPQAKVFDLERVADRQRIQDDADLLLGEVACPVIFDEAQLAPGLFAAMRVAVDAKRSQKGQYLITGSSSPQLLRHLSESLAGRVAMLTLEPLMWHECINDQDFQGISFESNLATLLLDHSDDAHAWLKLPARWSKAQLQEMCFYGGYPELWQKPHNLRLYRLWMENYIQTYVERDIRALFPQLKLEAYQRFIQMLAFSSGQQLNQAQFARSLDVSQPTIKHYFDIVEGTFLWRSLSSHAANSHKRLVQMPKGYLRDTGLLNHLLAIPNPDAMKSHPQFGQIWEAFVIQQIANHFNVAGEKFAPTYYRTYNGAEVDLVIKTRQGLIPIEIKANSSTPKNQLKSLEAFVVDHGCPFGLLINNGDEPCRLSDKIIQVPATCW